MTFFLDNPSEDGSMQSFAVSTESMAVEMELLGFMKIFFTHLPPVRTSLPPPYKRYNIPGQDSGGGLNDETTLSSNIKVPPMLLAFEKK